jgi:hypothetical protein
MILYRPTRLMALIGGVLIHLGMTAGMEVGPFPWVMISSYVAFLDPEAVPHLLNRFRRLEARIV